MIESTSPSSLFHDLITNQCLIGRFVFIDVKESAENVVDGMIL